MLPGFWSALKRLFGRVLLKDGVHQGKEPTPPLRGTKGKRVNIYLSVEGHVSPFPPERR